jgi:hypothetical protein
MINAPELLVEFSTACMHSSADDKYASIKNNFVRS